MLLLSHCVQLCNSMDCSMPGFSVLHCLSNSCPLSWWCHPTISSSVGPFSSCLHSFPASRSFSSESALHVRWPKYGTFSFSISPSNEYSGDFLVKYIKKSHPAWSHTLPLNTVLPSNNQPSLWAMNKKRALRKTTNAILGRKSSFPVSSLLPRRGKQTLLASPCEDGANAIFS